MLKCSTGPVLVLTIVERTNVTGISWMSTMPDTFAAAETFEAK